MRPILGTPAFGVPAGRTSANPFQGCHIPAVPGRSTETDTRAVSENSEHEPDGPVDLSCLHGVKATGEVA
jgi:hypothetical protein